MKKKALKLSLHRETLAFISGDRLEKAAGGIVTYDKTCLLSLYRTCSDIGCTDGCPSHLVGGC